MDKSELARKRAARNSYLLRMYGVTSDEYDRVLAGQGGGCAVCGRPPGKRRLAWDHSHRTRLGRGILCHIHNRGLTYFQDDPVFLRGAWDYLLNPPALKYLDGPRVAPRASVRRKRRRRNK